MMRLFVFAMAAASVSAVAVAAPSPAQKKAAVLATPAPPGTTKICSPYVPGAWRTVTPVPGTWAIDDCKDMGKHAKASMVEVACFFEKEPPDVNKFEFGKAAPINEAPTSDMRPTRNCGW